MNSNYQPPQVRSAIIEDFGPDDVPAFSYLFSANTEDLITLPDVPWTTVHIAKTIHESTPWIWRSAMVDRNRIIEVESQSDAKTKSMREEAVSSWKAFASELIKRTNWMNLIGIHPDLGKRMLAPMNMHPVRIVTMAEDYIERMYAEGNAEIVRIACLLKNEIIEENVIHVGRSNMQDFFWPHASDTCNPEVQDRYDRAIKGDFTLVSESIYAPN